MPYPDPGTPPLTTAPAYLWWVARGQAGLVVAAGTLGVVGAICQAALPYLLGRVVDGGLDDGLSRELWTGALMLLAVGLVALVANVVGHWADVHNWMRASFRTSQLVGHHVSRTGDAVTAELPTGEVVATVASDSLRVGEVFYVSARFIGGMVAYAAVAVVLLTTSVPLGLAVLLGIPAVAGALAMIVRPLQRRQAAQREQSGRLTTLGADTVSGLRILRGIGGEDVFAGRYREQSQRVRAAGVRVAQTQSLLDAMQALLPGLFLAGVVWYGARLALAGDITPGQLVAFYGYAAFLTQPLQAATEAVHVVSRALVGVRKILAVLRVPVTGAEAGTSGGTVADAAGGTATAPARPADLVDVRSGLRVAAGSTVALVSADPDDSARLALRLGLLGAHDDDAAHSVRLGGAPLGTLGLAEVRRRIVVGESTPALFSGLLRDELDVRGRATVEEVLGAVLTADAADVLDSVPDGLDGRVEEKGRSLSGGQRQRLALARALLTEPEVLVLIEPTSAVDAHTEARIAARLADARRGRTTVLVTASPLVLDRVDRVLLVRDGQVVEEGTHRELLDGGEGRTPSAAYRRVVSRAAADPTTGETPVVPAPHTTASEPGAHDPAPAAAAPAPAPRPTDGPAPREEDHHAAARR